ncbi:MAG: tRNA lysidine(34) synthetase TilS [Acidobacteria bacterium]|nr:tRNA lysidine(34) synthetase TilS [Acidobacteriota bacterium]
MRPLLHSLARAAPAGLLPRGGSVLLAVSGGADSLSLLYAAAELSPRFEWRLAAAHVHHGWRGRDADLDLAFVSDHARRLGLPFLSRRADARTASRERGLSPEAGARHVRYAALQEMRREAGAERIATAHHAGDALESYLLARERRGGVASLAGPRQRREDGVVRPMLDVTRAEIVEDLEVRGLSWRRDRTNGDLGLARNRIRRRVAGAAPALRREWEAGAAECRRRRNALDAAFAAVIAPALRHGPATTLIDARLVETCPADLQRLALEAAAAPFSRPGRPPMTGREREQVLERLATGRDFHFEAGRRIRIRRRGAVLSFGLSERAAQVYDLAQLPAGDIVHGEPAP